MTGSSGDLQRRRLDTVKAWTAFVEHGDRAAEMVRPEILGSWERSGLAITPDVTEAPLADEHDTAALWQDSPLRVAVGRIEQELRRTAEDGDLVLAVTDARGWGRVARIEGLWWQFSLTARGPREPSAVSLLRVARDRDGALELSGRAWQDDGSLSARYWSEAAKERKEPSGIFYYWQGERPRDPNAPQLYGTGEIRLESADRAAGYFTTRAEVHHVNTRTSGVYVRAEPEDLDILDGRVARQTGLASKFGSFYDSTLDRVSEIVIYFSIYAYFRPLESFWYAGYIVIAAMVGSLMVSYTRAKAESLGVDCKVGMMQRPERVVMLGLGGLLVPLAGAIGPEWRYAPLLVAIGAIAVLANFTALERIYEVYRVARGIPLDAAPSTRKEG